MEKLWQEKLTRHRCTPFNWYRDRSQTFFDKYFCLVAAFLVFYKQIFNNTKQTIFLSDFSCSLIEILSGPPSRIDYKFWKHALRLKWSLKTLPHTSICSCVNLSTQVAKCKIKVTTKRHLECEAKSFVQVVHKFWCICFSKEIHGSFTRFEVTFENWLIASI